MRLVQSILVRFQQTKQPQHKFLPPLLGLLLILPGHATFRNLSRDSPYHDKTFARESARGFDCVSLNKAAIPAVIPETHAQALVIDARCVPTSGTHTDGLDRFWNGSQSRTEKGVAMSALAWLDLTGNCAYGLSVEHTPPTGEVPDLQTTRLLSLWTKGSV